MLAACLVVILELVEIWYWPVYNQPSHHRSCKETPRKPASSEGIRTEHKQNKRAALDTFDDLAQGAKAPVQKR